MLCLFFKISPSSTLAMYIIGFSVRSCKEFLKGRSSSSTFIYLAAVPAEQSSIILSKISDSLFIFLSPDLNNFSNFIFLFSKVAISESNNSVSIVSISLIGSIFPSTCVIFSFSKQRTICSIAEVCLICPRN